MLQGTENGAGTHPVLTQSSVQSAVRSAVRAPLPLRTVSHRHCERETVSTKTAPAPAPAPAPQVSVCACGCVHCSHLRDIKYYEYVYMYVHAPVCIAVTRTSMCILFVHCSYLRYNIKYYELVRMYFCLCMRLCAL